MKILAVLFESLTFLGAVLGGFVLLSGLLPGQTAIQTGAAAAVGIGLAAIPYTIAGGFHRAVMRASVQPTEKRGDNRKRVACDRCRELIIPSASVCPHCGQEYDVTTEQAD